MKAAVITFHSAYNYGAVLQAYSLQKALETSGYDPDVIDYWPERRVAAANSIIRPRKGLKGGVINLMTSLHYKAIKRKRRQFDDFRQVAWRRTEIMYDSNDHLARSIPRADVFITGSDQVWNPSTGIDPAYFLDFAVQAGKPTASYAASIGLHDIDKYDKVAMARMIDRIDLLSVREPRAAEIIKDLTGRDAKVVVDPVFLQSSEQWNELVKQPVVEDDYLLVYAVRRRRYMENIIRQIKKRSGLKVVLIPGANPAARGLIPADEIVWDAGPVEFVNLFAHAKAVCTNSFHGTAFSLIYNKPFISVPHTKGDTRVSSILDRLGQSWRQLKEGDELPSQFMNPYDIRSQLNYHTQDSFEFIDSVKRL